jgi:hypothetical protein
VSKGLDGSQFRELTSPRVRSTRRAPATPCRLRWWRATATETALRDGRPARQQTELVALSVADHAAGNPVTGVAGRIGHVVVPAAVDHHRGAVGMEDGVGLGYIDGDCRTGSTSSEPVGGMCKFGVSPA